jgi:hypothetical protein
VQRASGIPHALYGREIHQRLGRLAPRGRERVSGFFVIASEAKQSIFLYEARWIASLRSQ